MNPIKRCGCKFCRSAMRHRLPRFESRLAIRRHRREVKAALLRGDEPPKTTSVIRPA
jgi:hypothetical protein